MWPRKTATDRRFGLTDKLGITDTAYQAQLPFRLLFQVQPNLVR
jgi:hypothetical protein